SATPEAEPNVMILRDDNAQAKVGAPTEPDHIARLKDLHDVERGIGDVEDQLELHKASGDHDIRYYTKGEVLSLLSDITASTARIEFGSFVGDGASSRTIAVGFRPKMVLVYASAYYESEPNIYRPGIGLRWDTGNLTFLIYAGISESTNVTAMGIGIVSNGFTVGVSGSRGFNTKSQASNHVNWIAFG